VFAFALLAQRLLLEEILLSFAANVNYQDPDGWTALHNASSRQHIPVVRLLIGRGADVNSKSTHGQTALSEKTFFFFPFLFRSSSIVPGLPFHLLFSKYLFVCF